jgi:cytochrome c oxidase subunit 2
LKNKSAAVIIAGLSGLIALALYFLFTRIPTMPLAASEQAAHVDSAWNGLLVVEGAIYALVMGFLLYCVFAFRAKRREEQGEKFDRSRGRFVEVGWLAVSIALTLSLAALGSHELRALISDPTADIDVEVRASQFSWEFYYPQFKTYGAKLFMEKGKRHRLILTSKDVVHAFWVPEFRLKQDAVPGKAIPLIITPTKLGEYTLLCNQLCGRDHYNMLATVEVLEHEDFESNMKAEF